MRDPEVETSLDVIHRAIQTFDSDSPDLARHIRRELLLHHQYKISKALWPA